MKQPHQLAQTMNQMRLLMDLHCEHLPNRLAAQKVAAVELKVLVVRAEEAARVIKCIRHHHAVPK